MRGLRSFFAVFLFSFLRKKVARLICWREGAIAIPGTYALGESRVGTSYSFKHTVKIIYIYNVPTTNSRSCLEKGIIPHVITDDGKDGYEIEIPYEEAEADLSSTKPEELKKALHAGQIPKVYEEVIQDMKVETVKRKIKDNIQEADSVYGSSEEMLEKAKEGYFVRDPERNLVYCPAGEILRQKSIKKNGNIRYANKNACKHCPNRNKCYKGKGEWKEIDFTKRAVEKTM